MIPIALVAVLLFPAPLSPLPQKTDPAPSQKSEGVRQERLKPAREKYESIRQPAVRLNELATSIHSEQDARAFIDAVAEALWGKHFFGWTTRGIRHRVAHAEYEAVADTARAIPEQRIADVWNEYVHEIDAPEEALVSVAEIHNMRDAMYLGNRFLWNQEFGQSIWTAPGIYAVDAEGKLSENCRAIEALKLIRALYFEPQQLQQAKERVRQGILLSDRIKLRDSGPVVKSAGFLVGREAARVMVPRA